jgi:bacterioferritin-associated ferredoxin
MYICVCNALTQDDIDEAIKDIKSTDIIDIFKYCKASYSCGMCYDEVNRIIESKRE